MGQHILKLDTGLETVPKGGVSGPLSLLRKAHAMKTIFAVLVVAALFVFTSCSRQRGLNAQEEAYVAKLQERVIYLKGREATITARIDLAKTIWGIGLTNNAAQKMSGDMWKEMERYEKELDVLSKERWELELRQLDFQLHQR